MAAVAEITMVCERAHDDGRAAAWTVRMREHQPVRDDGARPTDDGGDYGISSSLAGQQIVLARYAACPKCGEVGSAQHDATVFVV